jgi:hypothetical protein
MSGEDTNRGEGGAKERDANGEREVRNPAMSEEDRQALKNQSAVKPEQYPDRGETPA